eukprot:TRINITY_DN1115_c0_g4_i1.p1 TRINITY_DN1115_c0_g4~~TRINITY_DN1115_c0_g4_i1.p1  ORF type:complete len:683 (+),score=194.66 TRINITY_DN1115_c0_g4_i1:52-2049(+)
MLAAVTVAVLLAQSPEQRARDLVSKMTLQEKVRMLHGSDYLTHDYVGTIDGVKRLGIPAITMNDGPQGFRAVGHPGTSTQWPSGLTAGASWDVEISRLWGTTMGREFYLKGANIQLGPGVCVARVPLDGRNFEYMSGEDPYLGKIMVAPAIQGIQSNGVMANIKHFIGNNQEHHRKTESSNVDERTLMEIYMPPFEGAVEAGVYTAMCSYNLVNGVHACENNHTLNVLLKGKLNFTGWVMSDWTATHSTVGSALGGLDVEMPLYEYFGDALKKAVEAGTVPEPVVDDKVYRILLSLVKTGILDRNAATGKPSANVTSPEHVTIARQIAEASTVLLKNDKDVLPFKNPAKIAVIGKAADRSPIAGGTGSGKVTPDHVTSILQGVKWEFPSADVQYYEGKNDKDAATIAAAADVAVMVLATISGEGEDRKNLDLPSDEVQMARAVGTAQPKTAAVIISPGAVLTNWTDSVPSVLAMFMPGQEEGTAAAGLLSGRVNPSGKLPLSFPNKNNEVGFTEAQYPGIDNQVSYSEKLEVGYRWYHANGVRPKYPFGHGMSYTTFAFTNLNIDPTARTVLATLQNVGNVAGAEVAQLYLSFPPTSGEPPRQLKGFKKNMLQPGQFAEVKFYLTERDLSCWDATAHEWVLQRGTFKIYVGASSQDIKLSGNMVV